MADVEVVLHQLRALLGSGPPPTWTPRQFGTDVADVPDWLGTPSDTAREASRRLNALRGALAQTYASAAPLVDRAGQIAAAAQQNLDQIIAQWRADRAALAPYMNTGRGRAAYIALGQRRIDDATRVLGETQRAYSDLARRIEAAAGRLPNPMSPGISALPDIPSIVTPADDVAQWWKDRTQAERAALINEQPDAIGNLDGIPAVDRDRANRSSVANDLARVTQAAADHRVSVDEVRANPESYGLNRIDVMVYDNASKVKAGLDYNQAQTGAPTYLHIYKPQAFEGQGRAAIAINNPDKADNVAVVVPGTSHSVAEGWLSASDASNLYAEMKAANPSAANSVVAWMGYDAPDGFSDPRIASTPLAHEGAGLLAYDVNALAATHDGDGHFTLIGHSYGSTVVADAAYIGAKTNDVVLIGSPGTDMAKSAADFHLPAGGQVYVGSASTDPVTQLGKVPAIPAPGTVATVGLGPDPAADGYGSIRFKAEVPGITWNDHSHYYDRGSESARSMGLIASGQGKLLPSQDLPAPLRPNLIDRVLGQVTRGPLGALPDLELPRIPGRPHR